MKPKQTPKKKKKNHTVGHVPSRHATVWHSKTTLAQQNHQHCHTTKAWPQATWIVKGLFS